MTVICWNCGNKVEILPARRTVCPRCGVIVAICDTRTREVMEVKQVSNNDS